MVVVRVEGHGRHLRGALSDVKAALVEVLEEGLHWELGSHTGSGRGDDREEPVVMIGERMARHKNTTAEMGADVLAQVFPSLNVLALWVNTHRRAELAQLSE